MKKTTITLLALLVLAGCSNNRQSESTVSSSLSKTQQSSSSVSKVTSSTKKSSNNSEKSTGAANQENSSYSVTPSSTVEQGEADGASVSTETPVQSKSSDGVVGSQGNLPDVPYNPEPFLAGDFSSLAGTWQDEYGNQITVGANGSLAIQMAEGEHISEEARQQLSRDLYILNGYGYWQDTAFISPTSNDAHTSGLPRFSYDTAANSIYLVPNYAETYSGTFSRIN
ncbi:DUF6287 domain-containing protein [Streptococcus sp. NLN64]|uniref:DUF6287 domain-containing protein n=1 Tax=Streptococcus sp. NLN64 TaxID=2822799 RepID=UPI0018CB6FE1|nr:DUF6287 domain-containing protein [Streptococcus sp. NLN64]MBG9367853.1 membrane lipoprotein lipid attachment site-containing protein [Streptococcus sp. NLN64]